MGFPPSGANAEPPAALLLEGILCKEVNKVSCKYWVLAIGRARRVLVMRSISQAFALCSLLATASFLPGQVATAAVCIDYLDGTRCHSYPEPTPSAPGTTQGMRKSPSNQVVKIGGRAQITAGPFKPYDAHPVSRRAIRTKIHGCASEVRRPGVLPACPSMSVLARRKPRPARSRLIGQSLIPAPLPVQSRRQLPTRLDSLCPFPFDLLSELNVLPSVTAEGQQGNPPCDHTPIGVLSPRSTQWAIDQS
ncbi:MAG: hypothetical protein RLZZ515_1072 [Cyanobacteriota bacterium]